MSSGIGSGPLDVPINSFRFVAEVLAQAVARQRESTVDQDVSAIVHFNQVARVDDLHRGRPAGGHLLLKAAAAKAVFGELIRWYIGPACRGSAS